MSDFLFQREWNQYQKNAFLGQVGSQPGSAFIKGTVTTPSSGTKPRPGYPVFYNATSKRFEVPRTAAQVLRICGVVTYYKSDIANSDGVIEYANDTMVDIMIRGSIWVQAGSGITPTSRITWDTANNDWVSDSAPVIAAHTAISTNSAGNINTAIEELRTNVQSALNDLGYTRIGNYSPRDIADGELFEAYLSGGIIV